VRRFGRRYAAVLQAERLTTHYARLDGTGPQILLKRGGLEPPAAHKINNAQLRYCWRNG